MAWLLIEIKEIASDSLDMGGDWVEPLVECELQEDFDSTERAFEPGDMSANSDISTK